MEILNGNKDNIVRLPERYQVDGFQDIHRGFILPWSDIDRSEVKIFNFTDEDTGENVSYYVVRVDLKGGSRIYIKADTEDEAYLIERDLNKIRMNELNRV